MNDDLDRHLRAVFQTMDADTPRDLPLPVHREPASASRPRRRSPHPVLRLALVTAVLGAIAAVVMLRSGDGQVRSRQPAGTTIPALAPAPTEVPIETAAPSETAAPASFPTSTTAVNILVVGVDNHGCAGDDSATAAGVDGREGLGERSDTIMVVRVEPESGRAAVLSFPRDLWVKIAGTDTKGRINAAFVRDDPQRLVDTIYLNFFIPIDHYVQVDFCGFRQLVDAVGGVEVPFQFAARDAHSGLDIPAPGCHRLDGDSALAYVRSRHYQYLDPTTGVWEEDPSSDFGRISRQQDFLWRVLAEVAGSGLDVDRAVALLDTVTANVVTDADLTVRRMLELLGSARNLDRSELSTFRIPGTGTTIAGAAVIVPDMDSEGMEAVLSVFQGTSSLAPTELVPTGDSVAGTPSVAALPSTEVQGLVPDLAETCS